MPVKSFEAEFVPDMTYTPWAIQEKLRRALAGQSTQQGNAKKRLAVLLHLHHALEERFPRGRCDEYRHYVTEWLIGERSTTKLSEAQAVALLNWLTYREPASGNYEQRPAVPNELVAILEQSKATGIPELIDKRQLRLL